MEHSKNILKKLVKFSEDWRNNINIRPQKISVAKSTIQQLKEGNQWQKNKQWIYSEDQEYQEEKYSQKRSLLHARSTKPFKSGSKTKEEIHSQRRPKTNEKLCTNTKQLQSKPTTLSEKYPSCKHTRTFILSTINESTVLPRELHVLHRLKNNIKSSHRSTNAWTIQTSTTQWQIHLIKRKKKLKKFIMIDDLFYLKEPIQPQSSNAS